MLRTHDSLLPWELVFATGEPLQSQCSSPKSEAIFVGTKRSLKVEIFTLAASCKPLSSGKNAESECGETESRKLEEQ